MAAAAARAEAGTRRSRRRTGAAEVGKDLVDLGFQGDDGDGGGGGVDDEGGGDLGDADSMKGMASERREVRNGVSSSGVAVSGGSWARLRPQRRRRGPNVSVDVMVL